MFQKFLLLVVFFSLVLVAGCSSTGKTSVFDANTLTQSKPVTDYLSYEGEDGKTVLELLERLAKVEAEKVEGGTVVNAIDGVYWDYNNNKSWIYYVNGLPAEVLPDQYVTKKGDLIEWKYGGLAE